MKHLFFVFALLLLLPLTNCGFEDDVLYCIYCHPYDTYVSHNKITVYIDACTECGPLEARNMIRSTEYELCSRANQYCYNQGFEHCECGVISNCRTNYQCGPTCATSSVYCVAHGKPTDLY